MTALKIFKISFASIGGFISYALGWFDKLMLCLLSLMVLDYTAGILKAKYKKNINSKIGFKGILKKAMILMVVVLASVLQKAISEAIPLREVVLMFYIANEGISIIENLGTVIPIPSKVKEFFEQLKESDEDVIDKWAY